MVNKITVHGDSSTCRLQLSSVTANEVVIYSLFGNRYAHIQQDLSAYDETTKSSFVVVPLVLLVRARPHLLLTHFIHSSQYLYDEDIIYAVADPSYRQLPATGARYSSLPAHASSSFDITPESSTHVSTIAGPSSSTHAMSRSFSMVSDVINNDHDILRQDVDDDIIDLTEDHVDSFVEFSDVEYVG